MDFNKIVKNAIDESMVAGGAESVYGPNTGSTATAFSGDTYAKNDGRLTTSLFGGVMTRRGFKNTQKTSKKQKIKKAKYKKKK